MPAVGVTAGVIAAGKVANFIPVGNDMVKNGIITVAGLFLSSKKGFIGSVGLGMAASGINSLVGSLTGITGFDQPVFLAGQGTPTSTGSTADGYQY